MSDPEKQPPPESPPSHTQSAGSVTLNVSYVKSPRGIIRIVQIVLLMIAFACLADVCPDCSGRGSFFLFSTIFPWILCIIIFILYLFCLVEQIKQINWPWTLMFNAIIWAIVILISSALLADAIAPRRYYEITGLLRWYNNYWAAVVFGFLSVIAFTIDAFLHYQLIRS